ncbi:MAG TPA: hypothetical protein VHM19_02800 [Polyangiales bacterium]|nr:hypothetical protein [Polyangiales bacterium]
MSRWAASFGLVLVLVLVASGCAVPLDSHVRKRASYDFACAPRNLRIVDRADRVYRVAGCGSIATYECSETPTLAVHCDRVVYDDPMSREVTTTSGRYSIGRRLAPQR